MYASDYNYASDLSVCKEEVGAYSNDQTNCIETNYLFTGTNQWVINQNPNSNTFVLEINSIGDLNSNGGGGMNSYYNYEVRPVLYLNSNAKITSGTGSLNDPYKLSIN